MLNFFFKFAISFWNSVQHSMPIWHKTNFIEKPFSITNLLNKTKKEQFLQFWNEENKYPRMIIISFCISLFDRLRPGSLQNSTTHLHYSVPCYHDSAQMFPSDHCTSEAQKVSWCKSGHNFLWGRKSFKSYFYVISL